jgi:hypothetical protein
VTGRACGQRVAAERALELGLEWWLEFAAARAEVEDVRIVLARGWVGSGSRS